MESLIAEGTADAEVVDDAVEVDDDTASSVDSFLTEYCDDKEKSK